MENDWREASVDEPAMNTGLVMLCIGKNKENYVETGTMYYGIDKTTGDGKPIYVDMKGNILNVEKWKYYTERYGKQI